MAAIYLIRHGQARFDSEDYDQLSELGVRQARVLGADLKRRGINFNVVLGGTMKRHRQTAEYCLEAMGSLETMQAQAGFNEYDHHEVLVRHRPEFADRVTMAKWMADCENPKKAFQLEFEKALHRWRRGGFDQEYDETWSQFLSRCHQALEAIRLSGKSGQSIAVFTSGGPISASVGYCLGLQDAYTTELSWSIANGSISCLLFNEDKITLSYFNDYSHLQREPSSQLLTYR